MSYDPNNPPTRKVDGVTVEFSEQEWAAFEASRAPTLDEIKAQILALKKQKENGGITFNGAKIATDAEAVGDVLGGTGQSGNILTDSGDVIAINDTIIAALEAAIKDYRFKVKGHAATLVTNAINSNDLSAFDVNAGWPTNAYPLA